jgi:hypothetical protein
MTVKGIFRIIFEVFFLTLLAVVIFVGGVYLFPRIIRFIPFLFANWFAGISGPFLVMGFDILWIIGMRKWRPMSEQLKILKIILSVSVFALSASLLFGWCFSYVFRQAMD